MHLDDCAGRIVLVSGRVVSIVLMLPSHSEVLPQTASIASIAAVDPPTPEIRTLTMTACLPPPATAIVMTDPVARSSVGGRSPSAWRRIDCIAWAFSFFASLRVIAYLPTLHAIQSSGDSSQHSIWTWLVFLGSNLTMAALLYEQDGQRLGRAAFVSLCNALMCAAIVALIGWHRW
jgi:hypothetical protein